MDLDLPKEAGHKGRGSMTDRGRWQRGWRGAVQLLVGVFIGATLITPAVAHVGGTLNHLWGAPNHIRDKVRAFGDPRWVNANEAAGGDLTGIFSNLQIAADAVGATEIAFDAVGATEIAFDAVGSSEISTGAVGSAEVSDNSLASSDLGTGSVGASEIAVTLGPESTVLIPGGTGENGAYNTETVTATCPTGTEVFGASIDWVVSLAGDELWIGVSRRVSTTQWLVRAGNDSGTDRTLSVVPLCFAVSS
jgi:hypothetical protein